MAVRAVGSAAAGRIGGSLDTILPVRIVVDTNAFVGACLGKGPSSLAVERCIDARPEPLMGAALLAEYEDVRGRSPMFERCRLSARERDDLLGIFLARCRWTRICFGWRPNLRDEGDNHLVELAVAGGADAIVTHNIRHLKATELKFSGLALVTPAQLMSKEPRP
jgi:predicted nucleic acid-binding protein